ncbi:sensor domain-containing diguanylate cyclase [Geosporobacter ferrireducens]|uniref:sensor domain-containing diguanylate cyclase n=1 Tax=Geosporobacter ferrireducens TaxID=1424294 RepID=UPI0023530F90|nr:sensor domain-containing diguanylate cyclase [Geosporobacter ferrireducens]
MSLPVFGYTATKLHPAVTAIFVILPLWLNHLYHSKNFKKLNNQLSSMNILMRVNRELAKSNMLNEAMLEISNSIVSIHNLDELLQLVLEKAVSIIDSADKGSIIITNSDGKLEYRAIYGYDAESLTHITLSLEETFIHAYTKGESLRACIIKNPQAFNRKNMSETNLNKLNDAHALDIRATICAPIIVDKEFYGLINVDNIFDENAFREEEVRLMEYFANQVGIAIKNVRLFEKTLYLSRHDALTHTYNRHYFEELYTNLDKRAKRYAERYCICVIDLDELKQINDHFGHVVGDLAIKHFAKTLMENVRESDILSRLGGDEFVAVFLNSGFENTYQKIRQIREKLLNNPVCYEEHCFHVRFSFGISCFPEDSTEGRDLIKIADQRMYANKMKQKTTI